MDVSKSLFTAIRNRATETVELLLKRGANVDDLGGDGDKPLHQAVFHGHLEILRILLSNGANLNAKNRSLYTPLHLAVIYGRLEIVRILLSNGADLNVGDRYGNTPLHMAVERGDQEIVRILLSNGADLNAGDRYGNTPLHMAVERDDQEMVRILLSNGADLNAKNSTRYTPLYLALIKGYQEMIKMLLLKGADFNAETRVVGGTPLHIAVTRGNQDFLLECQEEITNMKIEKIDKTNISFYDILTKTTTSTLEIYMRNENIVAVLEADAYSTKFPKYFGMMKCNITKSMERKELLEQANQVFPFFINNFDCSDKICSYLSNQDIRTLIDTFMPLSISGHNR